MTLLNVFLFEQLFPSGRDAGDSVLHIIKQNHLCIFNGNAIVLIDICGFGLAVVQTACKPCHGCSICVECKLCVCGVDRAVTGDIAGFICWRGFTE